MSDKEWTAFNGKIPECGCYEIKVNNCVFKYVVEVINTTDSDTNERLNGFVVSKLTIGEDDLRDCSGRISKDDYLFINRKIITHFKRTFSSKAFRCVGTEESVKFYNSLNALFSKSKQQQEPKTAKTRFNATHTAFDVLVDYAFGGDKQAALEYLKTL